MKLWLSIVCCCLLVVAQPKNVRAGVEDIVVGVIGGVIGAIAVIGAATALSDNDEPTPKTKSASKPKSPPQTSNQPVASMAPIPNGFGQGSRSTNGSSGIVIKSFCKVTTVTFNGSSVSYKIPQSTYYEDNAIMIQAPSARLNVTCKTAKYGSKVVPTTAQPGQTITVTLNGNVQVTGSANRTLPKTVSAPATPPCIFVGQSNKIDWSERRELIKAFQTFLNAEGFNAGFVDGVIGPRSCNALRAFQRANGLKPTGIIDQQTASVMERKANTVAVSNNVDPQVVSAQTYLNMLGYFDSTPTGLIDAKTTKAVKAFQRDAELPEDGKINKQLVVVLKAVTKVRMKTGTGVAVDSAPKFKVIGGGSGFVVSEANHFMTNDHVIKDCDKVTVAKGDKVYETTLVDTDPYNDVALLTVDPGSDELTPVKFRAGRGLRVGDDVTAIGFPLTDVLGKNFRATNGIMSAFTGIKSDHSTFQMSAAIQPGNSGGPVIDKFGGIVGMAVGVLKDREQEDEDGKKSVIRGDSAAFAIKAFMLKNFLDERRIDYLLTKQDDDMLEASLPDIIEQVAQSTYHVRCHAKQ